MSVGDQGGAAKHDMDAVYLDVVSIWTSLIAPALAQNKRSSSHVPCAACCGGYPHHLQQRLGNEDRSQARRVFWMAWQSPQMARGQREERGDRAENREGSSIQSGVTDAGGRNKKISQ